MRVTFVLSGYSRVPSGGYKVVYEYANHLQERGHFVTVVHPYRCDTQTLLRRRARASAWKVRRKILDRPLVPWFSVHSDVRLLLTPDLRTRFIPDGDAIVATAWNTAPWVNHYGEAKGKKFYLIQAYETWSGPKDEVDATWKMPLHKIVVAPWLREIGVSLGERARVTYIPPGLDLEQFRLLSPISTRTPHRIGMMYHGAEWKGAADGIAALARIYRATPDLEAVLFGTTCASDRIAAWITYVENPRGEELARLYNSFAILLQPSWTEGWGLPGSESMACGAALVSTDNGGVRAYADDGKTALLSPPKDPVKLADNALKLLRNNNLRVHIAQRGHDHIQQFTWDRATDALEEVLKARQISGI